MISERCCGWRQIPAGFFEEESLLEETDEGALFVAESGGVLGYFLVESAFGGVDGGAVEIGLEDCGMDVTFAADGGAVAEAAGDGLDGRDDVPLGFGGRGEGLEGTEEVVGRGQSQPRCGSPWR